MWDVPLTAEQVQALYTGVSPVRFLEFGFDIDVLTTDDEYFVSAGTELSVDARAGVLQNDFDIEGRSLSSSVVAEPENGTLNLSADGSFVYRPATGFHGIDRFQYVATQGIETSVPREVTLVVADADVVVSGQTSISLSKDAIVVTPLGTLLAPNRNMQLYDTGRIINYGNHFIAEEGEGFFRLIDDSYFENHGTLGISAGGGGTLDVVSSMVNYGDVRVAVSGQGTVDVDEGGTLTNYGVIVAGGPARDGDPVPDSIVSVEGTLSQVGDGRLTTHQINVKQSGILDGVGFIEADVVSSGVVRTRPSEPAQITGSYIQHPDGVLIIDVHRDSQDSIYAPLVVSDQVRLAGRIELNFADNRLPKPGDEFIIFDAKRLDVNLDSLVVELKGADPELYYEATADDGKLTIRVIDDVDIEPLSAHPLQLSPVKGLLSQQTQRSRIGSATDVDRFTIDLESGRPFSVRVMGDGDLRPALEIVGPDGVRRGTAVPSGDSRVEVAYSVADVPGTYTIAIAGSEQSVGSYRMSVSHNAYTDPAAGGANGVSENATELNFTTVLGDIGSFAGVVTAAQGDELTSDWYQFSLSNQQFVNLAVAATEASDLRLKLYDRNLAPLTESASLDGTGTRSLRWLNDTLEDIDELYYAEVTGRVPSGFQLVVARDAVIDAEPNGDFDTAQSIVAARRVIGNIGDPVGGVYAEDDGHSERATQRRAGGDVLWMNSLQAVPGQQRITEISLAWASFLDEGARSTVLLYEDPQRRR